VFTKFKYILLALALVSLHVGLPVQADLQPLPNLELDVFSGYVAGKGDMVVTAVTKRHFDPSTEGIDGSDYPLVLHRTETELRELIEAQNQFESGLFFLETYGSELYEINTIPIDAEHQLLQIMLDMRRYFGKPLYSELDRSQVYQPVSYYLIKNGVSIGYCAVERLGISPKFIPYRQIVSRPENTGYLKQDLLQVPKKTVRFFDMPRQDAYTERYATLSLKMNPKELASQSLSNTEYILLRAFYPSQFEAVFAPRIAAAVNDHLQKFGTWQTD